MRQRSPANDLVDGGNGDGGGGGGGCHWNGRTVKCSTCGYHRGYPKAGTYGVSARTYWTVRWWADGVEGTPIPVTRTSGTAQIQINELQVVTR